MHISLKVGEEMDIGGVVAPVIRAIFLLDGIVGGDVLHDPAHAVFVISKILQYVPSLQSF